MQNMKIPMADVWENSQEPNFGIDKIVARYLYENNLEFNESVSLYMSLLWQKAEKLAENSPAKDKIELKKILMEKYVACLKLEESVVMRKIIQWRLDNLKREHVSFLEFVAYYIRKNKDAAKDTKTMLEQLVAQKLDSKRLKDKKFAPDFILDLAIIKAKDSINGAEYFEYLKVLVDEASCKGYTKQEMLDAWQRAENKIFSESMLDNIIYVLFKKDNEQYIEKAKKKFESLVKK